MSDLSPQYDPSHIEPKWSQFWIDHQLYRADPSRSGEAYSVVIPPPNVTGVLHMGHALNSTLQDILVRYARMTGKNVLWVVGTDHAGIATQNVVERQLAEKSSSREALGREAFVERVWAWRKESGGKIVEQLKRLGASCDFTRERFTMDEGLSVAVREAFVKLYDDGLMTRAEHLINWCPRCQTALSDLEVEHEEKEGSLWPMQYPIVGTDETITVATTRPETYLGDMAVAVNPDDERYRALIGRSVQLPMVERTIPIIADSAVDPEFGTGAVKITPAHDFNDFEMGNRHNLPRLNILNKDGTLNAHAGPYAGKDRFRARKDIVAAFVESGRMDAEAIKKHVHQVGHCYRCRTVVEPYLSMQWFVKMKPLAETAIAKVRAGDTTFFPENWEKTYFQWLEGIRDWCVSRQIWWGHQIPAWYCKDDHVTVSRETPSACTTCGDTALTQDKDVLDTWFSSSLWPFSTLGWPDPERLKEGLFDRYYPTSVLVTAFDIIFFWVARMMMMGLYFTGRVPFRHVYIHALVRDKDGQKMSKSKGNVVDPLDMMAKYGTDAFRFTLAALAAQGRDIRLDEPRMEGYRNFINKIWNATRFVSRYLTLDEAGEPAQTPFDWQAHQNDATAFAPNHWIRSRLARCLTQVDTALATYAFNEAALATYHYFWDDYCAWYIEWIKPVLNDLEHPERNATLATAIAVLEASLRMLHPFIPFVTEEIWQALTQGCESESSNISISLARMPNASEFVYDAERVQIADRMIVITETIRRLRGENRLMPALKLHLDMQGPALHALKPYEAALKQMAGLLTVAYHDPADGFVPEKAALADLGQGLTLAIPMQGMIDVDSELARLEKDKDKIQKDIQKIEAKFSNPSFIDRAPKDVVEKDQALLRELRERLEATDQIRTRLELYR